MGLFGGFGFDTATELWEYGVSASWPTGFCDRSMHSFTVVFGHRVSLGVSFSFAGIYGMSFRSEKDLGVLITDPPV